MKRKLTQRQVDYAKVPEKGEVWLHDTEVTGLGVRVRANGSKTYILRYKHNGRDKKITVGDAKVGKLETARALAKQHRWAISTGDDPQEQKRLSKALKDMTVSDLGEETLQHMASQKVTDLYIRDSRRILKNRIEPAVGDLAVTEVTTRDLDRIVRSYQEQPRTGNLCRALLSRMFKLAVRWGYRPDDPSLGVERFKERARERVLTDEELQKLMAALDASPSQTSADAVRLLLFTGSRPKELLGATWDQIDLANGIWTKPSQATKARRTHRVELGPDALKVLRRMHQMRDWGVPWVFPSESKCGHVTTVRKFWGLLCKRAGLEGVRMYDLRRTILTKLLSNGVDLRTVMQVSGHTQPTTLLRHYAHAVPGKQREALAGLFKTKGVEEG